MRCKDEIFRAGCVKCHAHRADFSAHFQGVLWPYAIRQETKQLCSRHDGFTLAGWHRRGGSTAYVMKIHHRETHPFLKRMKERIFPFLFNKTIYNYMIRSNWLKDKRMECSFVTKSQQASDKYPPRTGQKANINDWKRDKYQTDNLGRDKFQRGLRQIPNTNRISMFNFRKFQTLHCSTTNKTNHSNLPCGEKMYFPNAASGYEWNRMATLSIRFYSLHL